MGVHTFSDLDNLFRSDNYAGNLRLLPLATGSLRRRSLIRHDEGWNLFVSIDLVTRNRRCSCNMSLSNGMSKDGILGGYTYLS